MATTPVPLVPSPRLQRVNKSSLKSQESVLIRIPADERGMLPLQEELSGLYALVRIFPNVPSVSYSSHNRVYLLTEGLLFETMT